ncbi:sulfotransferase family protein [Synechococcus sp. AH-736-G21]|nr:sulfotransferase family protein [Synechococcus sp. AH-736-G21]
MKIVHLHGFKCAGSTFSWVLQKLYGEKLLYVESKNGNARLSWDVMTSNIDISSYSAITSHTLEYPSAYLDDIFFVEFVRNPYDRILSAYRFQKKVGQIAPTTEFISYLAAHRGTTRENYMTRRLSPQTFDDLNLWSISDDYVPIQADNLFVGSVELFDESLLLLEDLFKEKFQVDIDLAYPAAQNVSSKSSSSEIIPEVDDKLLASIINRDLILSRKVNSLILNSIVNKPDFSDRLSGFHDRCRSLKNSGSCDVKLKTNSEWIKL